MRLDILKCHGSGNDFLLIDVRGSPIAEADLAGVAVALSDRAGPVGSDGILLLTEDDRDHAFGMRMFNADGSEAETCLNGLRCVARVGLEALGLERAQVKLASSSAEVARVAELAPGVATIREVAGPASLDIAGWPLAIGRKRLVEEVAEALPTARALTAVAMPNPHLIAFVDAIDETELVALGKWCEAAPPVLPHRANVSFVEARTGGALFVRTFERGVGLTDACGSAMAAAGVAAVLTGRIEADAATTVFNPGGRVRVCVTEALMVTIEGNATFEWRGSVTVDVAGRIARDLSIEARYPDEIAAWDEVREMSR